MTDALADFERTCFRHQGSEKTVFRRGRGPGVIVMTEIPGITPQVAGFARTVAERGFTVVVPDLIGKPGKESSAPYMAESIARACISREFAVLSTHRRSPVTEWLRALGRELHGELGGRGIGAIGMCLTGNFALSLMLDPWLLAPVLSQPSLPFGLTRKHKSALHLGPGELGVVRRRAREEGVGVLGLRFTADPLCPKLRFEHLRRELGDAFEAIEIDSSPGNAHGISIAAHSVLARDFVDREGHPTRAALERVLAFLDERLRADDGSMPRSTS